MLGDLCRLLAIVEPIALRFSFGTINEILDWSLSGKAAGHIIGCTYGNLFLVGPTPIGG